MSAHDIGVEQLFSLLHDGVSSFFWIVVIGVGYGDGADSFEEFIKIMYIVENILREFFS